MKKTILLFLTMLLSVVTYGQSAKQMLSEIEGKWELDDNGNVTFVSVIEAPELSKDEIFNRALNYFTYNYVSGKSVIQNQDKEAGLLVGKGIYNDVHIGFSIITTTIDAYHILRVDAREGRARAMVTLIQYDKKISGGNTPPTYTTIDIAKEYPINPKGGSKTVMSKAFYKTYQRAMNTLNGVEKAIKEGNTSENIENSDW